MIDIVTCKLIFPCGSITKIQLGALLRKYTADFEIANFYPEIGIKSVTMAVVDIPREMVPVLYKNNALKSIEVISSGSKHKFNQSCCPPSS